MSVFRHGRLFIITLACLLLTAVAAAPAGADDRSAAKQHNTAAKRHFIAGEYEAAAAAYKRAFAAKPLPTFLYNIGQCYRRLGTLEGLKQALSYFKRHQLEAPDSANKKVVQDEIDAVRRAIAKQEREAASKPPAPKEPAADTATPTPETTPTTTADANVTPRARPLYTRPWLWTAVGALASLGAGVGLGLAADSDHQRAEELGADGLNEPEWRDVVDSGKGKALGANILFGLAGGLAATSVLLFVLEAPEGGDPAERRSVRLTPTAGVGAAGIIASGRF